MWPQGEPQPVVSTLNNLTGDLVANAAIVPAGTGGGIATYPTNDTDLMVDINGYFAPPEPGGLSLYPVAPCRVDRHPQRPAGSLHRTSRTVNVVGQSVRAAQQRAGVCLQRDGGAARRAGLSDAVAGRPKTSRWFRR